MTSFAYYIFLEMHVYQKYFESCQLEVTIYDICRQFESTEIENYEMKKKRFKSKTK